jgi:hypothetical protein
MSLAPNCDARTAAGLFAFAQKNTPGLAAGVVSLGVKLPRVGPLLAAGF